MNMIILILEMPQDLIRDILKYKLSEENVNVKMREVYL